MPLNYNRTIRACFTGYIVQAIVNNFVPLLFLTFQSTYDIPLGSITLLVTLNFGFQLLVDAVSPLFIDRIGYRVSTVLAHVFAFAGLVSLTILPGLFTAPFTGLLVSVLIYAVGGGLLEVLISPIVEACPTDNKQTAMSLLHSFYCWGHVGVVLVSTIFFFIFGIRNWMYLALVWAVVPAVNAVVFTRVPLAPLIAEGETGLSLKALLRTRTFWYFVLLMLCAGASEHAVSQWSSTFAERGLGVAKTIGDLSGPMFFAIMMGLSRLLYGKYGHGFNLKRFMAWSTLLCVASYLLITFSPYPVLALLGCGLCGLSVGIMWPGTFSMASASIRNGGTALFAFLALAGDLGCMTGPTVAGFVSASFGDNLSAGILAAIVFPVVLLVSIMMMKASGGRKAKA
ncbi:MFS transporter [Parasphaerochaeta coccoides]|uniref:Major facilitator superfamily MFS_1 n=1 Tax=Parasphaerochaeta coccoides (strain ATCC BAA-1237 / DSM 17374 / SPN1) TaxID=760011 RepID=F4GLQ7_PARC1|nr:MFS transporter [Parasphaerochaeta coccoides]AEC02451.1 major facilitator superfamily MFS_1 [Parasphaerochaeta coccoides DSM 17374]